MEEKEELIIVKQLPVIEERLKELSIQIDEEVNKALALDCTEENYKDVKKVRADLNKQYNDLESRRKEVKNAVLTPYNEFEEIYKKYVSEKFKNADEELKAKISNVENGLKKEKEDEIIKYFEELKTKNDIDFINYEQLNIRVGLSDSKKSIMKEIDNFFDKTLNELQVIGVQEHKNEILVEYQKDLNLTRAMKEISDRYIALERIALERVKNEEEKKEKIEVTDQDVISKIDNLVAPKVTQSTSDDSEILELNFKVRGTELKLINLLNYLDSEGLDYEQL